MILTLFGISVITFVVTRLAPGDPAALKLQFTGQKGSGGSAMIKQLIEETRRIYGFDKPMILNLRNENYITEADKTVKRLGSENVSDRENARVELREISSLALPSIFNALDSANQKNKATFEEEISGILPSLVHSKMLPQNLDKADTVETKLAVWREWWGKNKERYLSADEKKISDALDKSIASGNDEEILSYSGYAVRYLVKILFHEGVKSAEKRDAKSVKIAGLLSVIVKKPWDFNQDKSQKDISENFDKWKRWWKNYKTQYTTFSGTQRAARVFTATQYGIWVGKILTLDFDVSYNYNRPVIQLIKERLPVSIQLSLISIFLSYIIAIPLGIYSSTHRHTKTDQGITIVMFILYSLPSFWVASMLIMFTTGGDFPHIFPSSYIHSIGYEEFPFWKRTLDWLWHLVLPITCYTYGSFAFLSRQMRTSMLDSVKQDYIRTARAKGLPERVVIFKHALRNSLIPILTLSAVLLPELLGGSVVIEQIFSIDGMGKLTFEAIINRDYPIINGIFFFSAALTLLGIFIADLSYAIADPRITFD